jgi:glycosyltransferase involved in cell wall biosynthesis
MKNPTVSVVMAVYNGAEVLPRTLRSVLDQQDVDLEFIVINDGSTDNTGSVLDEEAKKDARLIVVHQSNMGLTKALIEGCALARAPYLARQDCGDDSLPYRLRAQIDFLEEFQECVAVTCHTAFHGPADEPMYVSAIEHADLNAALGALRVDKLKGPSHHGSVVMRLAQYQRVGGYREQFYYAQDLDLWTRLAEIGSFGVVPAILYVARYGEFGISSLHRRNQETLKKLICKCRLARLHGQAESSHLLEAEEIRPGLLRARSRLQKSYARAAGLYFIASCLASTNREAALAYCRRALALAPWHLRSQFLAFRLSGGLLRYFRDIGR